MSVGSDSPNRSVPVSTPTEPTTTSAVPLPKALKFLEQCGTCWWHWDGAGWQQVNGRQQCRESCTCQPPSGRSSAPAGEAVEWPCAKTIEDQRDLAIVEILRLAAQAVRLKVALVVAILAVVALAAGLAASELL